jgi:hypothetical protein
MRAVQLQPPSIAWAGAAMLAIGHQPPQWRAIRVYDALIVLPGADPGEVRHVLSCAQVHPRRRRRTITIGELSPGQRMVIAEWCLDQSTKHDYRPERRDV